MVAGQVAQYVDIARDEVILRNEPAWVAKLSKHFEASPGKLKLPLDGLIAICDAANRERRRLPFRRFQRLT